LAQLQGSEHYRIIRMAHWLQVVSRMLLNYGVKCQSYLNYADRKPTYSFQ